MSTCRKCTRSRTHNRVHGRQWTLPHRYPRSNVHRQYPTSVQQGCRPPCVPGGSSLAFAGRMDWSTACERSSASSVVGQQSGGLQGWCQLQCSQQRHQWYHKHRHCLSVQSMQSQAPQSMTGSSCRLPGRCAKLRFGGHTAGAPPAQRARRSSLRTQGPRTRGRRPSESLGPSERGPTCCPGYARRRRHRGMNRARSRHACGT